MTYQAYRNILMDLARDSIRYGLEHQQVSGVDLSELPAELSEKGACFVTLEKQDQLRGCIGSLEAYRPLAEDVVHNAFAAAFQDPRFEPLQQSEMNDLDIHISILSQPEPMAFSSEEDLLQQIRPEIDGLIIEAAGRRGTFLPSVWESLPDKRRFLAHLKMKAGLPQDYWSNDVKVWRYTTEYLR